VTSPTAGSAPGHAFISYVHEDSEAVDRLQRLLEASGVTVWRDRDQLWPGQDWETEIQKAITTGSLAFIACFSRQSEAREVTYQREEIIVATEQMRKRRLGKEWIFPVLLDEVDVPSYSLGAGRNLNSLQRSELFGTRREEQTTRLVISVVRLLDASQTPESSQRAYQEDSVSFMKATLLDPAKQIQLDDFVSSKTKMALKATSDRSEFPLSFPPQTTDVEALRLITAQTEGYFSTLQPLIDVIIAGCRWGRPEHYPLWTRAMKSVANAPQVLSGSTALVELQSFPRIPLLYAGALSALERGDFGALKAIAIDPSVRNRQDRESLPLVSASYIWRPFMTAQLAPHVLAFTQDGELTDAEIERLRTGAKGKRKTPISDYLYAKLRPHFGNEVPNDADFEELFDLTETYLSLLATDDALVADEINRQAAQTGSPLRAAYRDGAWYGQSSWRHRQWGGVGSGPEVALLREATAAGHAWPPLRAGLFGGSLQRALKAFEDYSVGIQRIRERHF